LKGCSAGKALRGVAGLLWLAHDDRPGQEPKNKNCDPFAWD